MPFANSSYSALVFKSVCRGLAVLVLLPNIRADATFVADTACIACDAAVDPTLAVRIRASWALGQ